MKKTVFFLFVFAFLCLAASSQNRSFQQPSDGISDGAIEKHSPNTASIQNSYNSTHSPTVTTPESSLSPVETKYQNAINRLKVQAAALRDYAREKHFNTNYCFLVDMSLPSGKKRFFVYNLETDSIEHSLLVAHGAGSTTRPNQRLLFSNMPNSSRTSLGKYKIGASYFGGYGLAYKLYGLDSTNNNAFKRSIVLHSLNHVPDIEIYPRNICESAGCPMVSKAGLAVLNKYITASSKPVLMWIYN